MSDVNKLNIFYIKNVSLIYGGNMRNLIKNELRNESGQGMTEYIIIVALIAIAAIGVVTIFGKQIRDLFGTSSAALSGQTQAARKMNKKAHTLDTKNLSTFGKDNDDTW